MSELILDELGLTKEDMENAESSAIAKVFEPMPSAAMEATVEDIVVYKNQWDGSQMRYTLSVTDAKGEKRTVTYRSDIGKELKDGSANKGYAGRLEQFSYATGVPIANLSLGEKVKIKSFGKELEGQLLVGMKGKKVKALVRLTNDTNKEEGQAFKYSNDVQGVVALNGTEKSGENAEEKFNEAIAKQAVFTIQGKTKSVTNKSSATKTESGNSVDDML